MLVAGPRQHARDVVRRQRAVADRGQAQLEPVLVVGEQLVDPRVRRRRDRAVGGQQREVRQAPDLGQRAEEVAERVRGDRRLEADRRRDRRQHVVPGEEQRRVTVREDVVALRVPRRVDRVEDAVAHVEPASPSSQVSG